MKKLDFLNKVRLELVQQLSYAINKYEFLSTLSGRNVCDSTYYVFPLRFISEKAGLNREDFVTAVNAEGIQFYEGYSKPLYLQPLYQRKHLYKYGYPFSAKENSIPESSNCPFIISLMVSESSITKTFFILELL